MIGGVKSMTDNQKNGLTYGEQDLEQYRHYGNVRLAHGFIGSIHGTSAYDVWATSEPDEWGME